MANKKISELPAATTPNGAELIEIVQGGASKQSTAAAIAAALQMNTSKLLGRSAVGVGAVQEIAVGSGLSLAGGTLSASGGGGPTYLSKFGGFNTVVGNSGAGLVMTFDGSTLVNGDFYHLYAAIHLANTGGGAAGITVIVGGTSAGTFTIPTVGCLIEIFSLSTKANSPGDTYQNIFFQALQSTGAFGAFTALNAQVRPISATTKALSTPLTIELRNINAATNTVTASTYGGFLAKF